MENKDMVKPLTFGLGSLIGYLSGLDWELLFIYLIMMVLDVIIAITYEAGNGKYKSRTNCYGLYKKVGEFLTLLALILVQRVTIKSGINIQFSPAITTMFILKEMGSILETLARNNVKLPVRVMKWFKQSLNELNDVENTDKHD